MVPSLRLHFNVTFGGCPLKNSRPEFLSGFTSQHHGLYFEPMLWLFQVPINAVLSQRLHAGLMRCHWVVWQRREDIQVSCLWMSYTAYWWYNSPCPSLQLVRSIDYQINLLHSFMLWYSHFWILHVVMLLTQIGCSWFILELDIAFAMTIIWVALQPSSFCMIEILLCTTSNQCSFIKKNASPWNAEQEQ